MQKAFQKDGHGQRKQCDLQQRKPGYAGKNPLQPAKGIDMHPMEIQVKIRRAARLKARHGAQDELVVVGGKENVAEEAQKTPQKGRDSCAPKPAASGAVALRQAVQPPSCFLPYRRKRRPSSLIIEKSRWEVKSGAAFQATARLNVPLPSAVSVKKPLHGRIACLALVGDDDVQPVVRHAHQLPAGVGAIALLQA